MRLILYSKIFSQIFDSSLAEDFMTRHVFMDLIVLADPTGQVDMTPEAISRRTNVPLDVISVSLVNLCKPDPRSRTSAHDGRRLIPLDDHRDWGWQIVNFKQYHGLKSQHSKREYMRTYMQRRREEERESVSSCKTCKPVLTDVTHEDEDVYKEQDPGTDVPGAQSVKQKEEKPIDPEIENISVRAFKAIQKTFPNAKIPEKGSHAFAAGYQTIDQLMRLDNYTSEQLRAVFTWLWNDEHDRAAFWRKQVQGISNLRNKKTGDTMSKFDKIFAAWEEHQRSTSR